ncbi:MAG: 3'-5' exonuclease [Nitrospina sp.]|jgi:DNA polymerase III subunit epsilon|nr:3'-5' exonuclease [Nitrospina sp.]
MDYLVLDLETANPDQASICQLGMVEVNNGAISKKYSQFIDPKDEFDPMHVSIHGITEDFVKEAPSFKSIYKSLRNILDNNIIVHHGPFDKIAIEKACNHFKLPVPKARWLDNQKVVRRTWKQFRKKGYALDNLCHHFDISLNHHDALEDAKATAKIFSLAVKKTGLSPRKWIERVKHPIDWY